MAIEAEFQSVIAPLVSGRCYPVVAPDSPVTPYAVYQVVSDVPLTTLEGPNGTANLRIQVDVWSSKYSEAKTLKGQIQSAIQSAPFTNIPLLAVDGYEPETKLYRVTIDFSVWSQ